MSFYLLFFLLILIGSCGKKPDSSDTEVEEDEDGVYYGELSPINSSYTTGSIRISKYGDSLEVKINVMGAALQVHKQLLHQIKYCPGIDFSRVDSMSETDLENHYGEVVVPLDDDISARDLGAGFYPSGSSYSYYQETSYQLMQTDSGRAFMDFQNRTFVVYSGKMPVACASIDRVYREPGGPEYRPRPIRVSRPAEVEVPDHTPPVERVSWWERLSDRLQAWWCRVRGRC